MTRSKQSPGTGDKDKGQGENPQPAVKPARTGNDFGEEGTNKTIPVPKPDGAPSEELGHTPHIEKTPYTRG
ncbi:MAG: hypothetical protein M3R45_01145 [Pseudomonadota bacterium]|nr:hypothetical protein [Pseudomonadota bacterium]